MAISMWKTASKGNPAADSRASSRTDRTASTRFLTGLEPREGRTLPSMTAADAGDSGPGPFRQEITDTGDGDAIKTSTSAERLLLRWQEHGDREAWDQLADIVMRAARRWSVAHHGRLKCSSFDPDDVSQEALHRFVRKASHIHPYNVHAYIRKLIDRSASDMNRAACRAKRWGTVHASVYWRDDSDYRVGKACSADSPDGTLATQEGLHSGVCFDESEMFYIRRAFEPYSDHAAETTAKAWRLAGLLSHDTRALAEGLGCSPRTILRQRANMQSQLESGLHLLRDEYRSVGKNDDALAVTELMRKLKKVASVGKVRDGRNAGECSARAAMGGVSGQRAEQGRWTSNVPVGALGGQGGHP
jgi:DNA-directed RNA polymerase specialized sigma24 family protein